MGLTIYVWFFFFSSRRRHTRYWRDWSSDVCSSDLESGEIICANCGIVMLDNVQESRPEWRTFANTDELDNSRSRTGMPISLARHDMGLATMIGNEDKDASGGKIDAAMRFTMNRSEEH